MGNGIAWRYLLFVIGLLALILFTVGPDIGVMVAVLVWVDLIIAFAAISVGFRSGSSGMIIGGAICGLIALSSAPAVETPTLTTLLMQIGGGALAVGSFIMGGSRGAFG